MNQFGAINDIQQNMASRLQQDMDMDKTVDLLAIIQELVPDKFGRIPKEAIIIEALNRGMGEDEVTNLIRTLILNRTLKEENEFVIF